MNHAAIGIVLDWGKRCEVLHRWLVITPDGTAKVEKGKLIQCHHYTIVCNNSSALQLKVIYISVKYTYAMDYLN